ncbi:SDR family oxidoreductase [Sphingomonas sp. So64.6b]|uniref:SDR family oxidoreductase n=1 Tax=Sphingomonas sp. So64.6b TaxID=2997354 RepID=UPI0015FF6CD5|nr:SDR family oxidoreductase [Sphingomonas sp. So64.6b]QNA83484.1 SDR family oxidoreductase [Sphingomonas sp. So64.6b]
MTDITDAHTAVTSLKDKRIIITGGTTGIGRAIAVLLASEGARVHICGRTPEHLDDALKRINEVGEGSGTAIDLAQPDNVTRYFADAVSWLGGLDVVVVNAAIPAAALSETSVQDLRYQIATDFTAYLLSAHAAVDRFGGAGDIVLIGSMSAHVLGPGSTIYAGMKAGIAGFAEALRRELGDKDIRVSLIEPGKTQADFHYPDIDAEEQKKMVREETMLRSEDIAVAVHFALTQPRRTVVQQMVVVPKRSEGE